MFEQKLIRTMRRLILKSYDLIASFPTEAGSCYRELCQWLDRAERWNEEVQGISRLVSFLTPGEVERLHQAQHFHTPVYVALSEKANIIFAAWFQAQAKLYQQQLEQPLSEALS